jgi:hypothetical protein
MVSVYRSSPIYYTPQVNQESPPHGRQFSRGQWTRPTVLRKPAGKKNEGLKHQNKDSTTGLFTLIMTGWILLFTNFLLPVLLCYSYVFNEMNHRYPTLPFTLRALDDEKQARMGVVECLKHDLLHPYPVSHLDPCQSAAAVR